MGRVEIALREGEHPMRLYAVKRLHPHFRRDPAFLTMFMDEARIASGIRHENVVRVLAFDEDQRGPFLLMEYIDGLPLSEVLKHHHARSDLPPMQMCLSIAAQAAEGLHAAHDLRDGHGKPLRIVHRDLSPQNALLGFDGVVRVTDFGVAKALGRATRTATGILKGKHGYMSPEQLRFEELDRRSDLFSLGVLLYELLTCQRLYSGKDGNEAARRILSEPPPDVRAVRTDASAALAKLITDLLAKDPGARPRTARSAAQRLEEILIDLRAEEPALDLASHTQSTFHTLRAAKQRKIERGLDVLGKRERASDAASDVGATLVEPAIGERSSAGERSEPSEPDTETGVKTGTLFDGPGNVLLVHGNVLIHVRTGEMTSAVLGAFERQLTRLAKRYQRAGYVGVIEPSAGVPARHVRLEQKALIETQLSRIDARLAVVIIGDGVGAKLSRAVARVLVPHRGAVCVVGTVREACVFLDTHVDDEARAGLHEAVQRARRDARDRDREDAR